jgi:DNA-directed RNA polymerase subunit RPC12/RpoP
MKKIKQGGPEPEKFQCTQCGSTSFTRDGESGLRCAYCNSRYRVPGREKSSQGPTVIIRKGANVVFGKDSHVTIRGGLQVEDGAHVSFLGNLELIEKSDDSVIEQARKRLGDN